jgi:hypothetical protein
MLKAALMALCCLIEEKRVSYEDSDAVSSSRIVGALNEADGPQQI